LAAKLGDSTVSRGGAALGLRERGRSSTSSSRRVRNMLRFARKFIQDEEGEDLMEYGLLVAFVASVAVAVIITDPLGFGTAIQNAFQKAVDAMNQA